MRTSKKVSGWLSVSVAVVLAGCAGMQGKSSSPMEFFVTSANPGKGADFGGLAGADRYCQALASAVGAGDKTWRAYLSTSGAGAVNARDRIGRGPWRNVKGEVIARDVEQLHGTNNLNKQTALTERGNPVKARGETPLEHDILTGSSPEGRSIAGTSGDTTCRNWTSGSDGSAIVGHHDRAGGAPDASAQSWNSSHPTRGCSIEALRSTGGGGYFYCFATN